MYIYTAGIYVSCWENNKVHTITKFVSNTSIDLIEKLIFNLAVTKIALINIHIINNIYFNNDNHNIDNADITINIDLYFKPISIIFYIFFKPNTYKTLYW